MAHFAAELGADLAHEHLSSRHSVPSTSRQSARRMVASS